MTRFEKASLILMSVAALGVIVANVYGRVVNRQPSAPRAATIEQRFADKKLPITIESSVGSAATVVLFISKDCHFCAESMVFYDRLTKAKPASSLGLVVVAAVPLPQTRQEGQAYFSQKNVAVDEVVPVDFSALGITGTPTLVLLDGSGRVSTSWVGRSK